MTKIVEGRMIITRINIRIPPMQGQAIVSPASDEIAVPLTMPNSTQLILPPDPDKE